MSEPGPFNSNHVQLVLPPDSARSLFQMLIGAMLFSGLACLLGAVSLVYALELASDVNTYKTEARLAQYDASELRDTMIQNGIKVPPSEAQQADRAKLRRK